MYFLPTYLSDVGCPLFAVTMRFSYWLMKKAYSAKGQAKCTLAGNQNKDREREKMESERCQAASGEARYEATSHEPHGKI